MPKPLSPAIMRIWTRQGIALGLITVLAAFLRFYRLGDYPGGFSQDEAVAGYDAWCLMMTGRDHHGDWFPPNPRMFGDYPTGVATYLTIPTVALFGPTVFAVRSICALLSTAAVPLLGLLVARLFRDRAAGLFAAAVLAISPWNLLYSRCAFAGGFVPFFLAAGMWMLHRLLSEQEPRRADWRWAIATAVVLFLWTQTFIAQYLFAPAMILVAALVWRKGNGRQLALVLGVYAVLMLVAVHVRLHIPAAIGRVHRHSLLFASHPLAELSERYWQYLSVPFLFRSPPLDALHQVPHVPHISRTLAWFYWIGLATLAAGITVPGRFLRLLGRPCDDGAAAEWRRSASWVLAWLLLGPVAGAMFEQMMYTPRVLQLLVGVLVIVALGCATVWHLLRRLPVRAVAPVFALAFALYLAAYTVVTARAFIKANPFFKEQMQYGMVEVMQYLAKQSDVRAVLLPRLHQGYIYHLMFTPVPPHELNPAEVTPPPAADPKAWNYLTVPQVGCYQFNQTFDPDEVARRATLRHQVKDRDGIWFDLYEQAGTWFVVRRKGSY